MIICRGYFCPVCKLTQRICNSITSSELFKNVDEKLAEIGFIKIEENEYGVVYTRKNEKYKYTHKVSILRKSSGRHILQSYDADLFDAKNLGNTSIGLTGYEMKLFLKKMRKMGLYSGKEKSCD